MGVLDRLGRVAWGISGRLIASYVLVTLAVVVVVEAVVLGYQAPRLVGDTTLQAEVGATSKIYTKQLAARYPKGVPVGAVLGQRGQPTTPGRARTDKDGIGLVVPAIAGRIDSDKAVTAVLVIDRDGSIVASSAPARYPAGNAAAPLLPQAAAKALSARGRPASGSPGDTRFGTVSWTLVTPDQGLAQKVGKNGSADSGVRLTGEYYLYVQAPTSATVLNPFLHPISAWNALRHQAGTGPLLTAAYVLVITILPVGVLFGLLASRRLVRRVRRLEEATVAVADGDYTVDLPTSGHDEVGRLEANFNAMTHQLGSAVAAERERAGGDARAAERSRIAREIHDAISQHLFGLRMIAAGMRRAGSDTEQVRAIERITEDALRDMQALLLELRPAGLDGAGLVPAMQEICAIYRERLGVKVDADLDDITVSEPVEHALLRVTQEACTNAVRHGRTRQLAISLTREDRHVALAVRDTGTGFDPTAPRTGTGLGHMRDRVTELGGTMIIDSSPGAGTTIAVRVPAP